MSARRRLVPLRVLPTACSLAGCNLMQSPLDPASPQARDLDALFWTFAAVLGAIWLAVMLALLASLRARRAAGADPLALDSRREHRMGVVVSGLALATGLTVLVLTGLSYAGQRRLFGTQAPAVTIRVIGHQWWWELRYADPDPSRTFVTANEIHLPVGQPVLLQLESTDVIHALWMPNLMGKQDLIPGRVNLLRVMPERTGTFRGQCAEFCGLQHAKMGLLVIVEEPEAFAGWRAGQIRPRVPPEGDAARAGEAAFVAAPCSMCHQIRGTGAAGRIGPELTHLASRRTLAAGTLPMSRGNLAAWIVDPHGIKPGVTMPLVKLDPGQLDTISAYLEGLR